MSKRWCCAAVKALCPPKMSVPEVDFSTMRQAKFWAASSRAAVHTLPYFRGWAGPRFLNVKNIHLLFLSPFSIMGKDVITANPCGVCGISWPARVYIAFMYSMNWAQVLLPTAVVFFKGIPIRWKCGRWQKPQCQTTVLRMFWMALYFNSWFPLASRQPAIYVKS